MLLDSSNITWREFNSNLLNEGENRLDASFYSGDSVLSYLILANWKGKKNTVGDYSSRIFYPGRLKRIWVDEGEPFFTGAQILQAYPRTDKFISPKKIKSLDEYKVKKNTILLTRSGTIGNCTLVTETLNNSLVTEDAIRIVSKVNSKYGYLYAYLKSKIGNSLVKQSTFGAVIDHVEPDQISNIEVPLINDRDMLYINKNILMSFKLKDEANKLIKKAEENFYKYLNLPKLDISNIKYLDNSSIYSWSITDFSNRYRLDSTFYNPKSELAEREIKKFNKYEYLGKNNKLFELPTYKRVYLDKDHGVPFLSGKNIIEGSFQDIKYLSKKPIKNLESYLIKPEWVLITMRGTCGKIRLIDKSLNNYGASHNIMRLIPDKNNFHPGFLFIFLWSDYGQFQIECKKLGSVVDVLTPEDCSDIIIPKPKYETQKLIGELVVKAFELRSKANDIEEECITMLENSLKN